MTLSLIRESQVALRAAAKRWLEQDPDPKTRDELSALIEAAGELNAPGEAIGDSDDSPRAQAWRSLRDRFATRLQFGTAGLRGRQEAGPNRMNRVTVAQAARGLADFLLERGDAPTVVIGYDGRTNSDVYARDSAELMQAAGVRAVLMPRPLPTPVLAFAVRHLQAAAGVMVTASHNPKWDNGYKVYLGNKDAGSQIVPPADAEIAAAIERVSTTMRVNELPRSSEYHEVSETLIDSYVLETAKVLRSQPTDLKVAYTAMHGVGWETFARVLDEAGVSRPATVDAQLHPDGNFPTVDFPNPEEPGALDLAYETASAAGAQLIIAHDPDADRLAVAVPARDGGWHRFGGNDIGKLLGWRAAKLLAEQGARGTLATSLVSSPALSAVAERYGLDYVETQTGFKWISRAPQIAYGYEEALGYLVNPDTVRDKDGISAAMAILDLAFTQDREGKSLLDLDDEFTAEFGAFESRQVAIRYEDATQLPAVMARLRAKAPTVVGEVDVAEFYDFETAQSPANILRLRLTNGTRIMIRPSGTEPKIKVYIDAVSTDGLVDARREAAAGLADAAATAMRALLTS